MFSRRRLAMLALAIASLTTSACADLTRPNEITIKAEPIAVQGAAARQAPPSAPGAPGAAAMPAPGGGG